MKLKFWSLVCGVAAACLLGSVSFTPAADPQGFKPTISANPTTVSIAATAKTGNTMLTYNAGMKHPYVEVWVSVNGSDLKKVLEDEGDGKGSINVTIEQGKKYRFVLTDFGKELASVGVVTKINGVGPTPNPGSDTKPGTNPVNEADEIAKAIVKFAGSKIGQKGLGDGQSVRLIQQAQAAAGARTGDANSFVARPLNAGQKMQMGDIIQFTNFVIKDGNGELKLGNPEHLAIVSNVTGNFVTIIHQNVDGEPAKDKSRIRSKGLDLSKKLRGSYLVLRSLPKSDIGTKPEPTPAKDPAGLAKAVLNFASPKVGQKGLGDGQCTRLVEAALNAAGAKPGKAFVWGRTLKAGETMQPGDIIQFKSFIMKDPTSTWILGVPDHTAIVSQVNGDKVTLIHQNVDGEPAKEKSKVRLQEYDFTKKVSGSFIVYRPEPK